MEHESESAPRGCHATHHRISLHHKISGLSVEATIRWLRNVLPLAHTRARGSLCRTPSESGRDEARPSLHYGHA